MSYLQHPAEHLTSNYKTDTDSNNYKLLSLGHEEHLEIYDTMLRVEGSRDIDIAEGFTLDKAGKNVLELRQGRDDETFRKAIKIKIRGNLSNGTIEDINVICEILFGDNFLCAIETWGKPEFEREPAAILISIADDFDARMMFLEYIKTIVMEIKAGGVRLYSRLTTEIAGRDTFIGAALSSDYLERTVPMDASDEDTAFDNELFMGQHLLADTASVTVPMDTTERSGTFESIIFAGQYFSSEASYMTVPLKLRVYETLYASCALSGMSFMRIPKAYGKSVEPQVFNTLYTACFISGMSYMSIPTAEIGG